MELNGRGGPRGRRGDRVRVMSRQVTQGEAGPAREYEGRNGQSEKKKQGGGKKKRDVSVQQGDSGRKKPKAA